MIEYKYVNDTEAALKRIKAECKMHNTKPRFQVRVAQSHHHEMIEGTMKQVEFILHHLEEQTKTYNEYAWVEKADSKVEVTVFEHSGVWIFVDVIVERIRDEDEDEEE
tara:strand:- start:187 stop:510 length:324 start_codon:yes stop_codon:yes gene_type:complete